MTNTIAIELPNTVAKITYGGKNGHSYGEISNLPIVGVLKLKNKIFLLIITTCNVKLTTNAQLFCFLVSFCIFITFVFESFETFVIKWWVRFNPFQYSPCECMQRPLWQKNHRSIAPFSYDSTVFCNAVDAAA